MTLISGTQMYNYSVGKYVEGEWTESPAEPGTFNGSIQPLNYKELNALQIGREDKGKIKIYSDIELPIGSEIEVGQEEMEKTSGAIITWQGKLWEVIKQVSYQMGIISHYKFIAEYRGPVET
ncbi:MAG: hypothetical protein PVI88_00220 [Nitrosopumilaceae archaeon]|jgi:hypothetical protein